MKRNIPLLHSWNTLLLKMNLFGLLLACALFSSLRVQASSFTEEQLLASTLWLEARGETEQGIRAVGAVLLTRKNSKHFPSTFEGVVLQRKQFSCWNGKKPEEVIQTIPWTTDSKARLCARVAGELSRGSFVPIAKWDHYFNPSIVSPSWEFSLQDRRVIGHHLFGRMYDN